MGFIHNGVISIRAFAHPCEKESTKNAQLHETATPDYAIGVFLKRLEIACNARDLKKVFSRFPKETQQDRMVAFHAVNLDSTGRVLQMIPDLDLDLNPLRNDRELVKTAIAKDGTNLKYVSSEVLKDDPELAITAITQTTKACKYIGDELKRIKKFVLEMLQKLISLKVNQPRDQSCIYFEVEPKRTKVAKYIYDFPRSQAKNLDDSLEFGDGEKYLPLGTDIEDEIETKQMELISSNPYAGQIQVVEAIHETLLHDPEVKSLLFDLDCVALMFNDMRRKEMQSVESQAGRSYTGMKKDKSRELARTWEAHYKRENLEARRLQCWPSSFYQPQEDIVEQKELTSMNQKQLKAEAKKMEITEDLIEACYDVEDTKAAMIKLIQGRQEKELRSMNQKQLKAEARKMKIAEELIEACDDAEDTKVAMIRLIQSRQDSTDVAISDSIPFWLECIRRTGNRKLLAEASKDLLADEESMLKAIKADVELFRVTPWTLRVSESFKKKLDAELPGRFLWITLGDARAERPSKANDSEMGEMIAAFAKVQKRTGLEQIQVPFLQLRNRK